MRIHLLKRRKKMKEIKTELAKNILSSGVTIFGGFVRDMVVGSSDEASDIDVLVPHRKVYQVLESINQFGAVSVKSLPNHGYSCYPCAVPGLRAEVAGVTVDLVVDPGELDLDVNGLLLTPIGLTISDRLSMARKNVNLVEMIDQIHRKEFVPLVVPGWRAHKVQKLIDRGWKAMYNW
jgi:predicted nucleotidyltransferase